MGALSRGVSPESNLKKARQQNWGFPHGVDHGVGRVARLFEPLATVLAENRYHSLIRTRKNVFWKKGTRQNRSRVASGESFPGATRPSICLVPCYADFAADLRTGKNLGREPSDGLHLVRGRYVAAGANNDQIGRDPRRIACVATYRRIRQLFGPLRDPRDASQQWRRVTLPRSGRTHQRHRAPSHALDRNRDSQRRSGTRLPG